MFTLTNDFGYVNVSTYPFTPPGPLNFTSALSGTHNASAPPIVVLTSGRAYTGLTNYGDAMCGTYANGACPSNGQQLWTVNDLSPSSETHAPLFGHALYNMSGSVDLSLAATELPYERTASENPVENLVGSGAALVALSGGIPINGGVAYYPDSVCYPNSYVPAPVGTTQIWNSSFQVQAGQQGNMMFMLKTRVLDCGIGEGPGTVILQLVLDGQPVGSFGDQQYTYNNTCHERTLAASYLALGLSQGMHTISGSLSNDGLPNLSASGDLALVYFGN